MTLIQAIIFGIVEGVTEFLPISSTGHLILTANLLNLFQSDFLKTFEIFIQLGAILAVVVLYWKKIMSDFVLFKKVIVAFLPTAIVGLAFYKIIKTYLLGNNSVVLWALFSGGVILIIFEMFHRKSPFNLPLIKGEKIKEDSDDIQNVTYKQAIYVGFFQCLAMIPGVSRSAATIIGGLSLGLKRKTIVEFSFLLAVPTMLAASGLDLLKSAGSFNLSEVSFLAVGFATSFTVAIISIKFLLSFIKNHTFLLFGVYRIALVLLLWLVIMR